MSLVQGLTYQQVTSFAGLTPRFLSPLPRSAGLHAASLSGGLGQPASIFPAPLGPAWPAWVLQVGAADSACWHQRSQPPSAPLQVGLLACCIGSSSNTLLSLFASL